LQAVPEHDILRAETALYPHSFLWHYLWIAPHALQAVIAAVMIRRAQVNQFPAFFSYTLFEVVNETALFVFDHSSAISERNYWVAYWVGSVVSIGLRFAVIHEVFSHVLVSYPALKRLSAVLFRCVAVSLLMIGVVVAAWHPGDTAHPIMSGIFVVDRGVSLMQASLVAFLFLFSYYFHLSWKSFTYGIAVGLAIFSCVDLATASMEAHAWPSGASYFFDLATMATYHCCVLIWLGYAFAPEASLRPVNDLPKNDLEQWNAELQRLLLQ
jgi:hypothetical protein